MDNKGIWLEIKDKNDLLPVANALLKSGYIVKICQEKKRVCGRIALPL